MQENLKIPDIHTAYWYYKKEEVIFGRKQQNCSIFLQTMPSECFERYCNHHYKHCGSKSRLLELFSYLLFAQGAPNVQYVCEKPSSATMLTV